MKKIFLWVLMLIGMYIFSNFLIAVGLNSIYKDIERRDTNSEVAIYQADATYVNGRIRGIIKDTSKINDKYLEISLYSKRNVLMGRRYIEVKNDEPSQSFEVLFKANDVESYNIDTVEEKKEGPELEIIPKEWTRKEIVMATVVTLLVLW